VLEMGSEKLGGIASSLLLLLEGKDGVSAAIIGFIAEYAASYAHSHQTARTTAHTAHARI